MISRIKKVVDTNPQGIAYKYKNTYITYEQLWKKASDYANLLQRQGSLPVIIYGNKDINVIVSILACIIANRAYVPVGLCTPLYRIKKIIEMTKASLVLTDEQIQIDNIPCCRLQNLTKFDKDAVKKFENEIVYIIFTSGSTGEPKGVPISKSNLNNFINWISNLEPLCQYRNINVLNQASFSFDLSVADLFYSLCNGHTLIAIDDDMNNLYDVLSSIDVAVMTPTFMKLCLLNREFNEKKYSKLKCIYFCGEQLEVKLAQKIFCSFPKLKVINAYGPTEATSAVSAITITKEMTEKFRRLPVGEVSNFATNIEIIDDEIVLKGASVFSGYLNGYMGGYYISNGINCYRTGDIGYIDDGKLYCKGRKDSQIKYKGYRIELGDIEYNINLIPGVKECAVIAKYNDNSVVKTIIAFVVANDDISSDYIRDNLKKYLPYYMIPKTIKLMDKLPINENKKIDRKVLGNYE